MQYQEFYLLCALCFGALMSWGIGANDVSNAVGTSVGSKAITIRQAIIIAAIFEFLGALLAGGEVTNTIKQEIVNVDLLADIQTVRGMLSALIAASLWLFIASFAGWPVSTTHTIVGAIAGFGILAGGFAAVNWPKVLSIIFSWIISPFLGMVLAFAIFQSTQKLIFNSKEPLTAAKKVIPFYIFCVAIIIFMLAFAKINILGIHIEAWQKLAFILTLSLLAMLIGKVLIERLKLDPKADKNFHFTNVEKIFAVLMLFTACAMAFAHGSNDVANAIGPVAAIVAIVEPSSYINLHPAFILLLGSTCIVIGLAMYGHKVIATVGSKITQLTPSRGFAATLAAATTVALASWTGLPISTTHTLVGGVLGIGLARGIHALNLNVVRSIILSWVVTVPAGAFLAVICYKLLSI